MFLGMPPPAPHPIISRILPLSHGLSQPSFPPSKLKENLKAFFSLKMHINIANRLKKVMPRIIIIIIEIKLNLLQRFLNFSSYIHFCILWYCWRALSPNVFSTSLLLKQLFTKHNRPLPPSLFTFSFPHVLLPGAARVLYLSTKLLTRIGKRGGGITPFAVASPIPYGASESDVLPNTAAVRRELIPVSSSTTALTRWWLFPFYPACFWFYTILDCYTLLKLIHAVT